MSNTGKNRYRSRNQSLEIWAKPDRLFNFHSIKLHLDSNIKKCEKKTTQNLLKLMSIFYFIADFTCYSAQILVAIYTSSSTAGRKKVCTRALTLIGVSFTVCFSLKGSLKQAHLLLYINPDHYWGNFFLPSIYSCTTLDS